MSNSLTRISRVNSRGGFAVWGAMFAASFLMMAMPARAQIDPSQILRATLSDQYSVQATPTSDPACPFKGVAVGAGEHSLLGPSRLEASHCFQLDFTYDHGVATFTGVALGGPSGGTDSGDSITVQYRGRVVPTVLSTLPTATTPAGGFWLLYEEACVWKGTGKFANIIDDCPAPGKPGRFSPRRGTFDFQTSQGNFFGVDVIRLSEP